MGWIKKFFSCSKKDKVKGPTVQQYKDVANKFRWRLLNEEGEVIACSPSAYSDSTLASEALRAAAHACEEATMIYPYGYYFQIYKGNDQQFYWRLIRQKEDTAVILAMGRDSFKTPYLAIRDAKNVQDAFTSCSEFQHD